ncbi:type II restriction endonuclease, partial [Helicobacter anseris]
MISFKQITPKDFNKSYNPKIPKADEIKSFKKEVDIFLSKAQSQKEEEFQKNEINKFLAKVYNYDCNTKGKVDSAIYVEDKAQVLIEVKSLNNNLEFPKSQDNPLSKALYESILYFLREHEGENNNSIKHIILCNPCEFYIFKADAFRIFLKDKEIENFYKNCDKNKGVDTSTNTFYKGLESYLKTNFDKTLEYTYFRLDSNLSEEALSAIYTLLSPQVLLDQKNIIDANTLNKGFYEELLYILGLQEVSENGKSGGKILITPSTTKNTLSDAIRQTYPKLDDEAIFTLITTWNNRLLFLRLLESMLLSCNHIQKPFLSTQKIANFSHLSRLFFGVLAKKQENRNEEDIKLFGSIPYLNSSLFDRIPLEYEGKEIGLLASNQLTIFPRSILKKDERFKNKDSLFLLDYLFEFLHAYDFTTTAKDIQDDTKQNYDLLINSAVLGLVFEKLNGYKEGSFYTPSFITSYMCKESITQAVIEKFNSTFGWECDTLEELQDEMLAKGYAKNKESYLATLLSIRICDPAVGSGHFLVSALNEMIKICYDLRLIKSLTESSLSLDNDEILIYTQGKIHQYIKPTSQQQQTHQIQVELFHLKKSIIENCLFGVDI